MKEVGQCYEGEEIIMVKIYVCLRMLTQQGSSRWVWMCLLVMRGVFGHIGRMVRSQPRREGDSCGSRKSNHPRLERNEARCCRGSAESVEVEGG